MKWIGLVLLVLGLVVSGVFVAREVQQSKAEIDVFHRLWQEDLDQLWMTKKLPEGWKSLRMVEYTALDKDSWDWIENRKPSITIDPEGKFKLEILVDTWDDEEGKAALVEYHLIDLTSEDKIWELGRTFPIRPPNPQ
jgi:hypothetical protein